MSRYLARTRSIAIISALTAWLGVSHDAASQTGLDMSATAFADLDPAEILEVRAGRDLPLERDLVVEVRKLLSARGFTVADRGAVIVTVDSTTPLPGIESRNAFTNDDRLRTMDNRRNDRAVLVPFDKKDAEPGASVFTIRMSAYRPGQSNLWVGQASAPDNGSGRRGTTLKLAGSLAEVFGKTSPKAAPEWREPASFGGAGLSSVRTGQGCSQHRGYSCRSPKATFPHDFICLGETL